MRLINIESTPIQYKIHMEPPRLEMRQAQNPSVQLESQPVRLQLRSRNIQVQLDTTAMRESMGLRSVGAFLSDQAGRGRQAALDATAELARFGRQVGAIEDGVTIAQLVAQQILQQPGTVTAFIPSVGPEISWLPGGVELAYQPPQLETDWQTNKNVLDYIPGKFEVVIEQYPTVEIEYLGEPQYVPPSASPTYEEQPA